MANKQTFNPLTGQFNLVPASVGSSQGTNSVWVDFVNGNDSTGSGSYDKPWKSLQHAFNSISPTINNPYIIFITGGASGDNSALIGKPNVTLQGFGYVQIDNASFTITGGATNDTFNIYDCILVGTFTWTRNDATSISLGLYNTSFFGTVTFEQTGAGQPTTFFLAVDSAFESGILTVGQSTLISSQLLTGTWTVNDTGASFHQILNSYIAEAVSFAGGCSIQLGQNYSDVAFGYTLTTTTTGTGTPTITSDVESIPVSHISGPGHFNLKYSVPRNCYIVGPDGPYTTIQSAINQAVTDGHNNDISNPAFILIYPKDGGSQFYTEDLTLKDGVSLIGMPQKGKGYTIGIQGSLTYTPQGVTGPSNGIQLTLANLYILLGSGKNINLTGANAGRLWIRQCYIDKNGGAGDSMILMNGNNSSIIEAELVDGNITAGAAGCTIWDIQNGSLNSFTPLTIGSTQPGKILNCAANGKVTAQINSNCTGTDAITIAAGGTVTLALSSITNNQANSNGANIASGGTLTALDVFWNIPTGTGRAIKGVAGSVYIYGQQAFAANHNYSTAIGAGAVALVLTPTAA